MIAGGTTFGLGHKMPPIAAEPWLSCSLPNPADWARDSSVPGPRAAPSIPQVPDLELGLTSGLSDPALTAAALFKTPRRWSQV